MKSHVPTKIKHAFAWVPEIRYTGRSIDKMNTEFFNMRMRIDGTFDAARKSVTAHQPHMICHEVDAALFNTKEQNNG